MTGTVKRLISDKGFGFIRGDNETEYFFHRSECRPSSVNGGFDDLREGHRVEFREGQGPKGPRAEDVRIA